MFEWLEQEIAEIKTPRFHVVDGPADAKLRDAVKETELPLPSAYREFVLRFGSARLYRNGRIRYRIGIFAGPRKTVLDDGTPLYHLGFNDGASVYVKGVSAEAESPIFEYEDGEETRAASGFEEWLSASSARARKKYKKAQWKDILRGPEPFTDEEVKFVEARKAMRWRDAGIAPDGDRIFEITNAGRICLGFLTVGVRSKDSRLNGAVFLKVGNIKPGETATVHAQCYKTLKPPEELELFDLPEPMPEDREFYWEFKRADL